MKITKISLIVILFYCFCATCFAAFSSNRLPNGDMEDQWGSGNVLARRWLRSSASNTVCATTSDAYAGNGALFVKSLNTSTTCKWTSQYKIAIESGTNYKLSAMVKYAGNTSGSFFLSIYLYDDSLITPVSISTVDIKFTGSSNGNWISISTTFAAPANAKTASVAFGTENANTESVLIADNVTLQSTNITNMLINPSMEKLDTSYTSAPPYWRRNTSITNAMVTTLDSHTGTQSLWISHDTTRYGYRMFYNADSTLKGFISVQSDRQYVYGGWMKWSNITSYGVVGYGIQYMNNTEGNLLDSPATGDLTAPPTTSVYTTGDSAGWVYMCSTTTPPVGARYMRFIIFNGTYTTANNPTAFYDDVFLQELPINIIITPGNSSIGINNTLTLNAINGVAPYSWVCSDTTKGTIDSNGLFLPKGLGAVTITVTDSEGNTGSTSLTVVPTAAPIIREWE